MRPLVRVQLTILAIVAVISMAIMLFTYVQVQTVFGIDKMVVTAKLPTAGGLYERANVTYRGDTVGIVKSLRISDTGLDVEMELDDDLQIPREGLRVDVHSMSAIGEQYVDLVPTAATKPYLEAGDLLPESAATIPTQVGPLLNQASDLLASIPQGKLHTLIDSAFRSFEGTQEEMVRIVEATRAIADEATKNPESTDTLIRELGPFLRPHAESGEAVRTWSTQLAQFTAQIEHQDTELRSIIQQTPETTANAQQLVDSIKPTVPVLLANLVSLGQVALTYNVGIEQILVLYPPMIAGIHTMVDQGAKDGAATADFHLQMGAPPSCTTGYIPADQRRDGSETSIIPTPPGQFCAIPQDSPVAVRGARNLPCMEVPGKRAPTPEACRAPGPYQPKGPLPSSIDGSGQPDSQGLAGDIAPAAYDEDSGRYVAPDGGTYRQQTLAPTDNKGGSSWEQLMVSQQQR